MTKRREFMQQAMAGMAGLAMSPLAFSPSLGAQKKTKLGVALVGLGYYSTDVLAPSLLQTQHCYLAGIVTGTPSKAERWKQTYSIPDKNIYDYGNFDSIANNPAIDIVYIVLPPSMHEAYCIRAAATGKQVWCEKPMAMTVLECQNIIDACNKNKVKLSIGYRMHHEPNTKRIIQFRKDLTYGKVLKVEARAGYVDPRSNHWKQKKSMGGGAMLDMGVYPLNAARYSTGLEPIAVTAHASTTRPEIYTEVEETISFDLEFAGGAMAVCEASFGKSMGSLQVDCQKGWYKLEPFQGYSGVNGVTSDGIKLNATLPNQQARQMDDDALAILNNTSVMVPGEEGLKDIRVVEAIYYSVAKKMRVVMG